MVLSTTFLNLLTSKAQVTRLAAIQLVIMLARTSLMFRYALARPGMAPQTAPAAMPPRKAMTQISAGGTTSLGMPSASIRLAIVPIRYWPGAPMLKRPVLYATATERPVIMSGVARKSILPTLVGLKPKLRLPAASRPVESMPNSTRRMPSHALLPERLELVSPTIRTMMLPTARPMRIERMEASTVRVPSLL